MSKPFIEHTDPLTGSKWFEILVARPDEIPCEGTRSYGLGCPDVKFDPPCLVDCAQQQVEVLSAPVTSTPEPSTYVMLGLALVMGLVLHRLGGIRA